MEVEEPFDQIEAEIAQYVVAGYVSSRFSTRYPELVGSPKSPKNPNWIDFVSKGNLKTSSDSSFPRSTNNGKIFQKLAWRRSVK